MGRAPRMLLWIFGLGAIVAGGLVLAVAAIAASIVVGPVVFWIAWNVLDLGPSVGLPELGFWAIVLASLFLVGGWFVKVVITGAVFLSDPGWFHGAAQVHWPQPSFRNFVAVALLAVLASRPHARAQGGARHGRKPKPARPQE